MFKLAKKALLALSTLTVASAAPEHHKVASLPEIGDITGYDLYAGHVNVTGTTK